ncbi:MAG: hypothetical protein OJF58_003011 [Enhydrobacter sp.]|nr:MAG: hypothetical protein OJF58_003011 [Enhydrobacter sp.]
MRIGERRALEGRRPYQTVTVTFRLALSPIVLVMLQCRSNPDSCSASQ